MQIAVCTYGCFLGSGDVKVSRMQEASDCCSVPSHSCVSLAKGIGLVGGEMHEPAAMDIDAMIQASKDRIESAQRRLADLQREKTIELPETHPEGAPYVARADGGFVAGNAVTQLAESSIPPPSPSVVTAKSSDCELVPPIQSKEDLTLDYMGCGNSGFPSGMTPSPQPNSRKPKSPLPAPNDPSSGTPGSKEAIVPKEAVPEHPIAPMSKETTSSAQPAAALPATPPPPPQLPDEGATAFLDVASYSACAYMHLKVTPVYRIQGSGGM